MSSLSSATMGGGVRPEEPGPRATVLCRAARRGRQAFTCAVVLAVSSVSALPATAVQAPVQTKTGEDLASEALTLLRRVYAVGMPKKLPRGLRGIARTQPHTKQEYEEEHSKNAYMGFIFPEFLRWKDRALYRDLERFWETPPLQLLSAAPHLANAYL